MGSSDEIYKLSASALLSLLEKKELSALDAVEASIARIEQYDSDINAVVIKDFDRAIVSAKNADNTRHKGGNIPPLLGLPITVKESFNVEQLPTSWGVPQFANWIPKEDSLIISRLKDAGAIIIGKTNVPFMLHDWQTFNKIYGTTVNPWDANYTCGGSSGGSAAALTAGFSFLELGSDFAGSIRVPSSFCGIYGHKPSIHLLPLRGVTPPTTPPTPNPISDLIVAGPMAKAANDLKLALDIMAGPDPLWDGPAFTLNLQQERRKQLHDYRVLIIDSHPMAATDECIVSAIAELEELLMAHGVAVTRNANLDSLLSSTTQNYMHLFAAFVGANMLQSDYESLCSKVTDITTSDSGFDALITRGCVTSHRDWLGAKRMQSSLRSKWRQLLSTVDVIITPAMSVPAFKHDQTDIQNRRITINNREEDYNKLFCWPSIATLLGFPSTVAPISRNKDDLPIGVQIMSDYLKDNTTITFADCLEHSLNCSILAPLS